MRNRRRWRSSRWRWQSSSCRRNSWVTSLMYGVSPQPAQAPENSNRGWRNWLFFTVLLVDTPHRDREARRQKFQLAFSASSHGMRREAIVRAPFAFAGHMSAQLPQPVQSSGAYLHAELIACEAPCRWLPWSRKFREPRCSSLISDGTYAGVRANQGALVALYAVLGVSIRVRQRRCRAFHTWWCRWARQPSGASYGNGQLVAILGQYGLDEFLEVRIVGHGPQRPCLRWW